MILCVYDSVVVQAMYTCKTENFETRIFVYVGVVVEGMYKCKSGNF